MRNTLEQVGMCAVFAVFAVVTMSVATEASASVDDLATRVRGTYIRVDPPEASLRADSDPARAGAPHLLYMNRCVGGLTITPGNADNSIGNVSSIADVPMHFPEYPFGDAAWNQLLGSVQDIFAPFNIVVTDEDPGSTPHDEAVVCGADTDFPGLGGAAGVAPFTCDRIPNAITYTFPVTIGNDHRYTVETIAQEAAHAWGLDHSFKCEDPMTYLLDCGDKSFQDGDFSCGEYEARACSCGPATQNTVQHILGLFGPAGAGDAQPPVAAITSPSDGDTYAAGEDFDLEIAVSDDTGVAAVTLFTDGEETITDSNAPFDGWDIKGAPAGDHEFYITVTDAAGNETISETVTVHVTSDGSGPDGSNGSGSDDDDNDPDTDPDSETDGDVDPDGDEAEGGIPFGPFPTSERGDDGGCACTSSATAEGETTSTGLWMLGFLALGLVRRRRA